MSTVDERAQMVYNLLKDNLGHEYPRWSVLQALGLEPGHKTDTAIRRARDFAAADGLYLSLGTPRNAWKISVTDNGKPALTVANHMRKIRKGVQRVENAGMDYAVAHAADLPADVQRTVLRREAVRAALSSLEDALAMDDAELDDQIRQMN